MAYDLAMYWLCPASILPNHETDFFSEVLLQKNVKYVRINCPSLAVHL